MSNQIRLATVATLAFIAGCATSSQTRMDRSDPLVPCTSTPRCVSSQNATDSARHVEPIAYEGSSERARAALLDALKRHANARVESGEMSTLRASFRTPIGFVDDVTFAFRDDAGVIDVKSTSRVGYYDFGLNRRRVEQLRSEFNQVMATSNANSK